MFNLVISIILVLIAYIIYKKRNKSVRSGSNIHQHDHAIILGGSIGGMVTAAYLSKYFKRITIIESDDVLNDTLIKSTPNELFDYRCRLESPTSLGRSGVSQTYQLHVLQDEGYKILRELFPELENKLFNEYNVRTYSFKNESRLTFSDLTLHQDLAEDIFVLGMDRFSLEIALRKELCLQFENKIEWKCNSRVQQLIVDESLNIVKGIKYRCKQSVDSSLSDIYGDFIIDCTGKNSSSLKWLKQSLNLIVPTEEVHYGGGYITFIGERFKTGDPSLDSKYIIGTSVNSPYRNVGCFMAPVCEIKTTDKNSLGHLSALGVNCVNSEYPPNDSYENLLNWIKEHLEPEYYLVFKSTKIYGPLIPYRRAINDRKYTELLGKKWPQNYILLGDAMCAFNPSYGQGMTHACRHARLLNQIFNENAHELKDISHIFNSRASKISNECWLISTGNDWKTPTLKVIKTDRNGQTITYHKGDNFDSTKNNRQARPSLISQFFNWYNYWFIRCASKSGQLSTDLVHVMNQRRSPDLLMKPTTFLTVCYTALIHYFHLSKK